MEEELKKKLLKLFIKKGDKRKIYEVIPERAKPLTSLYLISQDLNVVLQSIQKAERLSRIKSIKIDQLIIAALYEKAIMTYGKVFLKSEDGFSKLEVKEYIT